MKFGVRQCANIVFRAKREETIGSQLFHVGQPVLYIDSATTSSIEQSTTTVYAQGGRGNVRLISWEGEKTVTFSFTDALLSPIGFSILSGAGLFKKGNGPDAGTEQSTTDLVHFHTAAAANLTISGTTGTIKLAEVLAEYENNGVSPIICTNDAPIYIMETDGTGDVTGALFNGSVSAVADPLNNNKKTTLSIAGINIYKDGQNTAATGDHTVMVDFYVDLPGSNVWQADITGDTFGGNYYVEADTLFRTTQGQDLAANITFPNVKIQSNFTLTFASTGDPSTFDFTMDAFPDYTYFDKTKKVICVVQFLDYTKNMNSDAAARPVMYHDAQLQHGTDEVADGNIWYLNPKTGQHIADRYSPSNVGVTESDQ